VRAVDITGITNPGITPPAAVVQLDAAAKEPDLIVTVVADPANDGRQFWCTVKSRLLPEFSQGVTERWNLNEQTLDIVKAYMDTFTKSGLGTRQRIAELRGAGMKLFRQAPPRFQAALWELIDSAKGAHTIAIISEEPYIPWELMVPRRERPEGGFDSRDPLGVEFAVGRWTRKDLTSGRQRLPLRDSYVVAPNYPPRRQLKFAQQEATAVLAAFPGDLISPANFDTLDETMERGGRTLIHFACHGASAAVGRQVIALDNDVPLSSDAIAAMSGLVNSFRSQRPLVFLNACEVGRPEVGLVGIGGFAEAFIDAGAGAVVAALWSVKDTIAHEIATTFYKAVRDSPGVPFAEILRRIRAKAYDPANGEDTYAAYCFYGDPNAIPVC
jgi:hypothetical protein